MVGSFQVPQPFHRGQLDLFRLSFGSPVCVAMSSHELFNRRLVHSSAVLA